MTDVTSATTTSTSTASSTSQTDATTQNFGEEFTSFIQLLTAQVRNQDPLSPMDSTQFVEQLATFSTLEQQVRSNESLESIATMIGDLHAIIASDWIGQKISVESSWVPYTGSDVEFTADIPESAERAVLTVRDSDGEAVHTKTLKSKDESYVWDGDLDDSKETASDGLYQMTIDLFDENGDYLGTIAPRVLTTVTDVTTEDGEVVLGTDSYLTTDVNSARKEDG